MSFFQKINLEDNNVTKKKIVTEKVDCLIIGSGPAGYTASIYTSRANLKTVLYQGLQAGGQLTTTTEIENFPGYPNGVSGFEMMEDLKKQAERFGVEVRDGVATKTDFSKKNHKVWTDDGKLIEASIVIIATGATAKYLGLESETKFLGSGVSACATCDGFFYRNLDVAVVGGGDTAAEEAVYLSGICKKVYLIIRKNYMRASKTMRDRVLKIKNIEILFEHNTKKLFGNNNLEGAILINKNNEEVRINISGFFVAIGHKPNSDIFKDYLETDEIGYIITEKGSSKTNVEGVFACGDVQDSIYRQAITAAGSGCQAALDAERYLKK